MKIQLNKLWRLSEDINLSVPLSGKIHLYIDGSFYKSISVWNRGSINSILALVKMYCDWIETESKVSLLPEELNLDTNNIMLCHF